MEAERVLSGPPCRVGRRAWVRRALPLLAVACLGGCGGGGLSAVFSLPGPPNAFVSSLSDGEREKLCDSLVATLDASTTARERCQLYVHLDGSTETESDCEAAVGSCAESGAVRWGCPLRFLEPGACTATIREVESCYNADISLTLRTLSSLECPVSPDALEDDSPQAQACLAIRSRCPAVPGYSVTRVRGQGN